MTSTAKIFKKSKGSIVFLPSKFRLKGHQAYVHRDMQGNVILSANKLNPSESLGFSDKRSKPAGFFDLEYEESLQACQDQLAWLRTLFMTIKADPDVERGFLVYQLASIGDHLSETWMNQLTASRKESNPAQAS